MRCQQTLDRLQAAYLEVRHQAIGAQQATDGLWAHPEALRLVRATQAALEAKAAAALGEWKAYVASYTPPAAATPANKPQLPLIS